MILVDTSAWIEFLRDTGSAVCARVDEVLDADLASCDPIRMEVLAGARNDAHLRELARTAARAPRWYRRIRSTTRTPPRSTGPADGTATRSAS